MEWIDGLDLAQGNAGSSTQTDYRIVLSNWPKRSEFIHRHDLIHFDLKPSNILVTRLGESNDDFPLVKIVDFGFTADRIETLHHSVRGTPDYLAPELIRGSAYDFRVDIYALGILFYATLTGHVPYRGDTLQTYFTKHLNDPIPRLTEECLNVPLAFEALVCSMMAKDPKDRPSSAIEVAAALLPFASHVSAWSKLSPAIPVQKVVGRDKEIAVIEQFMSAAMAQTNNKNSSIATALPAIRAAGNRQDTTALRNSTACHGKEHPIFSCALFTGPK